MQFNCSIKAYADDLKVIGEPGTVLQSDLDTIDTWSIANSLYINTDKCETIHFGPKNPNVNYNLKSFGGSIVSVRSYRDLGLLVDDDLSFRSHLNSTITKANRLIGCCFRLLHTRSPSLYLQFYKFIILPIIDYCSIFYVSTSKSSSSNIEKIQKRFTKKLYSRAFPNEPVPNYDMRLIRFELPELSNRFMITDLVTLFKINSRLLNFSSFQVRFSDRMPHRIILSHVRTALFKKSFFYRSLTTWNKRVRSLPLSLPLLLKQIHCHPLSQSNFS